MLSDVDHPRVNAGFLVPGSDQASALSPAGNREGLAGGGDVDAFGVP